MSPRRRILQWLAPLLLLGAVALLTPTLGEWRRDAAELAPADVLYVVSGRDAGPGSLREALSEANAARRRARIVVRVEKVRVLTALPPSVNRHGIVLEGESGEERIDASGLDQGFVLDLHAPSSAVRNLRIHGAPSVALVVRGAGAKVEGVELADCEIGILALDRARGLRIENSRFERNRIGVRADLAGGGLAVEGSRFAARRVAGIWAVRSASADPVRWSLEVSSSRFEGDDHAIVAANVEARIEGNDFIGARTAAMYLSGTGAVVRGNRVRRGAATGILAAAAEGARIVDNEIDHNAAVGLLLNSDAASVVQGNRLYDNGYGIVAVFGRRELPSLVEDNGVWSQTADGVFVAGASPILRRNRVLSNAGVALRILDLLDGSQRTAARPLLEGNRLESNAVDEPVFGVLRLDEPPDEAG